MLTRTQKDAIWDIIPASYTVAAVNPADSSAQVVTFVKDEEVISADGVGRQDVQVVESFAPDIVRYPTVQIQYAEATTRANFMFFRMEDTQDHSTYERSMVVNKWQNIKTTPLTFDINKDANDPTSQLSFFVRMPNALVTSWLRFEIEKQYNPGGGYNTIYSKMMYPEVFGEAGKQTVVTFTYPYLENDKVHRFKLSNISIGDTDTGLEVGLDLNFEPVREFFKPSYFETHGNIENLVASIRVASDAKTPERDPGMDYFCNAQDIVDTIIKDVQLAFFRDFDEQMEDAQLVTTSLVMDITPVIAGGQQEQVVGKQIDFLIANKNELRTEYTTPIDADTTILYE